MAKDRTMIIVILLLVGCCCMSSCISSGLWATNVLCDTTSAESQIVGMNCAAVYDSSAPAPGSATDPRSTVWTTGQKLQGDPLEIGTAETPLGTQPTLPTTATYSISMDLNIEQTSPNWRAILTSKDGPDWNADAVIPNTRRPLIGITGANAPPADQIFINHTDSASAYQGHALDLNGTRRTGADYTFGKWFNLTVTLDSAAKVGKLYINGTKKGEFTAAQPFAWPSPSTTWSWNSSAYGKTGSIKVANAYFFSTVLTDAQISQLAVPSATTPGAPTTSYFTPEPYSSSGFMSY